MARVLVCRLSQKRRALLVEDPRLVGELRNAIRDGIPGALDLGRLDRARRADLAARLGAEWACVSTILFERGERLVHGARTIAPSELEGVSRAPAGPPARRAIERVADRLRDLIAETATAGEYLLVIAPSEAETARTRERRGDAARRRAAHATRVHADDMRRREMSSLDDRVVRTCLHTPGMGLRHPNAEERRACFWDLADRLFEPTTGAVRLLAIEEVRELVLLWAAGGEAMGARSCAALMLAHVVRGSGPHEERARDEIRALFEELGESVLEILGELGPAGQAAIAFVCVRVGFAEDMIVQRVKPEEMRARIRAGELPRSVYVDILG